MPYLDAAHQRLPFQSGSDTSRAAAVAADAFLCEQAQKVWAWISERGHGTQKEAHRETDICRASLCPRFAELEAANLIVKGEDRREGCAVYVVRVPSERAA